MPFKFKHQFGPFAIASRDYAGISHWRHLFGRVWIKEGRVMTSFRGLDEIDLLWDAFTFREFEAESWRDYALIPIWLARWTWAYLFSRLIIAMQRACRGPLVRLWIHWSTNSRWSSVTPVICPRCLWAGQRRQCDHGYNEYEAEDNCPRCGRDI
jgi:hypothetical protein